MRQQFVATVERVGQRGFVGDDAVIGGIVLVDHETAAHRVIVAGGDHLVLGVVGGEAHAVGMERQLLPLVHRQVALFVEGDLVLPHQVDALGAANALQGGRDEVGVDQVRPVPFQPQQDRLVGAVAAAGQGERAEHLGADTRHLRQSAGIQQPAVHEALGRAHRAHRMRGTRADADLEQVERADCHAKGETEERSNILIPGPRAA